MDTTGQNQENSSTADKQLENKSDKPLRGFNTHPENINRAGRPSRQWTWKSLLEEAMEEELKEGKTAKHFVARSLIKKALLGDVRAIEVTMDRMDGKPDQKNTVEGTVNILFHDSLKQEEKNGS